VAAAIQVDGEALALQPGLLGGAERGVLRCRLSLREVAVLDVSGPRTNPSRRRQPGGAVRGGRDDLDQPGRQDYTGQWIAGQVLVY